VVALIAFCACSFSDPDLSNTRFSCDGDVACPEGQLCNGGTCHVSSHDGIACGAPCSASEQCCNDLTNPPRCIPASDNCPGTTAFCDGREDCPTGTLCCSSGVEQNCAAENACARFACQQAADCPSSFPNCCPDDFDPQPWSFCSLEPC
jgi:hypothetical protein